MRHFKIALEYQNTRISGAELKVNTENASGLWNNSGTATGKSKWNTQRGNNGKKYEVLGDWAVCSEEHKHRSITKRYFKGNSRMTIKASDRNCKNTSVHLFYAAV